VKGVRQGAACSGLIATDRQVPEIKLSVMSFLRNSHPPLQITVIKIKHLCLGILIFRENASSLWKALPVDHGLQIYQYGFQRGGDESVRCLYTNNCTCRVTCRSIDNLTSLSYHRLQAGTREVAFGESPFNYSRGSELLYCLHVYVATTQTPQVPRRFMKVSDVHGYIGNNQTLFLVHDLHLGSLAS
jgi:hypothetical protein